MTLTIHMMTAVLAPGDAIGNYVQSLHRILRTWGVDVRLYADYPNPQYPLPHYPSAVYQPTGRDILWMHFSIDAPGLSLLATSPDYKILDSHGVTPPTLFHGYDEHLEALCAAGGARLPTLAPQVDLAIAHTDYIVEELEANGFGRIQKLPLVVDTQRFRGEGDREWVPLLRQLDYLLFVGRIVPQKGLKETLGVFAQLHALRPTAKLFLVGPHPLPRYTAELERLTQTLGIEDGVVWTGPINEPQTLASFYRHARFYLSLSEWESFCVPLVEALHFGTPVLSHAVPPLPETMGPGGVILAGSPAQMAHEIATMWDDRERYQRLQQQGYAQAANFTDGALRQALWELFSGLGRSI